MRALRFVFLPIIFAVLLSACETFQPIEAGPTKIGDVTIDVTETWVRVNPQMINSGGATELWTRDSLSLNALLFYAALDDGDPIFDKKRGETTPPPTFSSSMDTIELQELI